MQLWDTAGLERAGRMTSNYYNYSHAVLLMYDVTDSTSLNGLQIWYDNAVRDSNNTNTKYFLVGNKIDETSGDIVVTEKKAVSYANDVLKLPSNYKVSFRISAKTGQGFDDLLQEITMILAGHSKSEEKPENNNIIMDRIDGRSENKQSKCC